MAWNSGNIKKVGINEIKKKLQDAFNASANHTNNGAATEQALENELKLLGYEPSFFGREIGIIHLYKTFGYLAKKENKIWLIYNKKSPISLADMAEKLHQILLESRGGNGKTSLVNLFEKEKELFEQMGLDNPQGVLEQYKILNKFATYFGREYHISMSGDEAFLEPMLEGFTNSGVQPAKEAIRQPASTKTSRDSQQEKTPKPRTPFPDSSVYEALERACEVACLNADSNAVPLKDVERILKDIFHISPAKYVGKTIHSLVEKAMLAGYPLVFDAKENGETTISLKNSSKQQDGLKNKNKGKAIVQNKQKPESGLAQKDSKNMRDSFLQKFWEIYQATKEPVRVSEVALGQTATELMALVKEIRFLRLDEQAEVVQLNDKFVSEILSSTLQKIPKIDLLQIPAPVIGGARYGPKQDMNLKAYFGFKCQQKTFLAMLKDILIPRTEHTYALKSCFDKRSELLQNFWKTLDKKMGSANIAEIAKLKKHQESVSDLIKSYDALCCPFLERKGTFIHFDIEKFKREIAQYMGTKEASNLDIAAIQSISIDGLSIEEYFGIKANEVVELIQTHIAKERKTKAKVATQADISDGAPKQRVVAQGRGGEENDKKLIAHIKNFIIEHVGNSDVVDTRGYVLLETLIKHTDENIKYENLKSFVLRFEHTASDPDHQIFIIKDKDSACKIRLYQPVLYEITSIREKWQQSFIARKLSKMAIEETWEMDGVEFRILNKYLTNYFDGALYSGLLSMNAENITKAKKIVFNTGLLSRRTNDDLFLVFVRKTDGNPLNIKSQKFEFEDVVLPNSHKIGELNIPKAINLLHAIDDVILNVDYVDLERTNFEHILDDKHLERIADEHVKKKFFAIARTDRRIMLQGALDKALKKCRRDYKYAIPNAYRGEISFLLPIFFDEQKDKNKPAMILALTKVNMASADKLFHWRINTCLSLEMAYGSARTIAKPESDWLRL